MGFIEAPGMNGNRFNPNTPSIVGQGGEPQPITIPPEKLLWQIQVADHPFIGHQRTQLIVTGAADIEQAIAKAKQSPGYEAFKQHFPSCSITGAGFLGACE